MRECGSIFVFGAAVKYSERRTEISDKGLRCTYPVSERGGWTSDGLVVEKGECENMPWIQIYKSLF